MKLSFAERIGIKKPKIELSKDNLSIDLKNTLWSIICTEVLSKLNTRVSYGGSFSELVSFFKVLWIDFFKWPIDSLSVSQGQFYNEKDYNRLRDWFFKAEWYDVYELLEFIAEVSEPEFQEICNNYLKKEFSAYRFVNGNLVELNSKEEVIELEKTLKGSDKFAPVQIHIKTALKLISDKKSPDYRNSIKESISAVESLCKIIINDEGATLGAALTAIEKKHNLPKSLKAGFSSIYGYTSDNGGIRHGLLNGDVEITFDEARFMLIACSAFINYLTAKI
jgi:AbiJ N-terminal domain 4